MSINLNDININDILEKYPIEIRNHAERVAELVKPYGKIYEIIALLHDIIEDTDVTLTELHYILPTNIIYDIFILTRKDDETYFDYINYIAKIGSKRAIIVKYYDILDHLYNKTTLKPSLEKRYLKAKEILEEVI